jgi:hypothetical protein
MAVDPNIGPGTEVLIFKLFSPKKSAKNGVFFTQNKAKFQNIGF